MAAPRKRAAAAPAKKAAARAPRKAAAAAPAKKRAAAPRKRAAGPGLRAVAAGEKAPSPEKPQEFQTIAAAAAGGSARDLLVATRNRIAKTLDEPNCPARDQASLSRRLLEIRKEIEAIDAAAQQEARENAEAEDTPFDASAI